jgi:membrane protein
VSLRRAPRLAWLAALRYLAHNGPDRAAAIAFYTLLSLLPLLIFLISFGVRLLGSFDRAYAAVLILFNGVVLPLDERSLAALRAFVERAIRLQWPGILLLAWTARRVFGALISALEGIFEAPARGFARGNLMSFAMVFATGFTLLATLAATMLFAAVHGAIARLAGPVGASAMVTVGTLLLTYVIPSGIAAAFFFFVYRFFPRRELAVGASDAALGALVATVLWEIAKAAFAWYVSNLARYGGLFGALEGIIVLALWLELSASIVLYGGEVVALLVVARSGAAASEHAASTASN